MRPLANKLYTKQNQEASKAYKEEPYIYTWNCCCFMFKEEIDFTEFDEDEPQKGGTGYNLLESGGQNATTSTMLTTKRVKPEFEENLGRNSSPMTARKVKKFHNAEHPDERALRRLRRRLEIDTIRYRNKVRPF